MKFLIIMLVTVFASLASAQVYVCKDNKIGNKEIEFVGARNISEKEFSNFVASAAPNESYEDFGYYDVLVETTMIVRDSKNSAPLLEVSGIINQADVVFEFIAYDRTARFITYFDEAGGWLTINDTNMSFDDCESED